MNNLGKVQKKKKTQKMTPFWAFAIVFKKDMLRKGVDIPNDTCLREMAGKAWSGMTNKDKDKYKDKAKNSDTIVTKNRTLYNSLGQDIGEVEASKMRARDEYEAMIGEIKLMVDTAYSSGELHNCVFYFVNAMAFYKGNDDIYPAEIAMAKFSLKEGVFEDLHIRINPGQLPMGSGFEAQEKSIKCHKLPVPPNCDGETDYIEVLKKMIKFLHPMDRLPVFFTNGNTRDDLVPYTETCKIVKKIFYEAEEDGVMADIKIYPIDEFFFILQRRQVVTENTSDQNKDVAFPSIAYASNKFKSDTYEYSAKGCEFHGSIDGDHVCCLSKVRRYGYTITEWCNSGNDLYPLIEGKHFPIGYHRRK